MVSHCTKRETIFNLDKRIINRWYKIITAKSLIITLAILTIISLILFFIINTDFNKEQTATETIITSVQESVQDIKAISNDKTVSCSEKFFMFCDFVTKTVGIIPPLLLLLTIITWIFRQVFLFCAFFWDTL